MRIIVAVDTSSTVGPNNFRIAKFALINLVDSLKLNDKIGMGMGILQFSTRSKKIIDISPNTTEIKDSINSMKYIGGWTNTKSAIILANIMGKNYWWFNTTNILLIITDGYPQMSENPVQIERELNKTTDSKDKEIATLKNKISHLRPETPYIARNIVTGKEKEFKSYAAAYDISKIGPHQFRDNYLDKPVQCRGWTFRSPGKPYWKVPENFIFNQEQKASAHMIMFKSVHKTTGVETYFNSITEASEYISKLGVSFENSETNRRTLNRLVNEDKPTKHPYLAQFSWSKIESCGSWTYPDGHVENVI